jgi:NADPH-dependent 2,4-dienoyl-CoA reductase/sulfur reductase-like enzyme
VPFPKITLREHPVFVILGAGAAGNAAAETLRREGFEGQIVMVTAESDRPYDRPNLSKQYMAGTAKPEWIPLRSEKFYSLHQIDLLTDHRVTAVDPDSKHLTFENGNTLAYDRLLLATGGRPRTLDIPGTQLKGYFLLRSWADANAIIASLQNTQTAVIVGTGFIGMEVASSLRARNLSVHVVGREESPMKFPFGDRVSNYLKRMHEEKGVAFHLNTTLREIVGQNRVDEVVLADGTRIKTDIVIAGLGIVPAVEYLQGTNLVVDGAVPVDPCLRTKAKDIFAAGDIALVPTPPAGTPMRVEHWVVAERLGQHAARTMLGSDAAYDEIPFFWTRQYDNSLQYVGHAAEFDRIAYRGDPNSGKFLAGYYLNGSLKAVAGMKMNKEFLHLGRMLKANITISPDHFENEEFSLTEIAQLV